MRVFVSVCSRERGIGESHGWLSACLLRLLSVLLSPVCCFVFCVHTRRVPTMLLRMLQLCHRPPSLVASHLMQGQSHAQMLFGGRSYRLPLLVVALCASLLCFVSMRQLLWDLSFPSGPSGVQSLHEGTVAMGGDVNYTAYLPATLSVVPNWYAANRKPDSLSMMLPPRQYRRMSCSQLLMRHVLEHAEVGRRNEHHRNPEHDGQGLLFRDPYPVCGRYILPRLTGGVRRHLFVLRVRQAPLPRDVLTATAEEWSNDLVIEDCGDCGDTAGACVEDVLFMSRLFNDNRVVHSEVVVVLSAAVTGDAQAQDGHLTRVVRFRVPDPGDYTLEVKMVHLNGGSNHYRRAATLGLVSLQRRGALLSYNGVCDLQRHVYGSPLQVRVLPAVDPRSSSAVPHCNFSVNYNTSEGGQWVRFVDCANPSTPEGSPHPLAVNCSSGSRYCDGDPTSLTDSGGHNNHLVWAPSVCRLRLFAKGTGGPKTPCLRTLPLRTQRSDVLFAGDSIALEYHGNCLELQLSRGGSNLQCRYARITVVGAKYTRAIAKKKIQMALDRINVSVGVFATNMGMQHMIGTATTAKWIELVDTFVHEWKRRKLTVLRGPYTMMPPFWAPAAVNADDRLGWQQYMWAQNQRGRAVMEGMTGNESTSPPCMEWAVWLSPPTVHYATAGMTHQREVEWDRLAYERLQKIGFVRLDALTPTLSRQESTWDGLHYMVTPSAKGEWPQRISLTVPQVNNGGVSFMLFLMLLNVMCFS